MNLIYEGMCPCGGILKTTTWKTKTHEKGRTSCPKCGRTELKERPLSTKVSTQPPKV